MIKVITIDFWNTLFDSSNGSKRNTLRQKAILNEIEQYDFNLTEEIYDNAIKASWEYFNNIWMNEQKTPNSYDTVNYFWNFLGLPHNPGAVERISRVFSESTFDFPPNMNEGVKQSLEILSTKFKLGIISDTGFTPGSILRDLLEQEGILKYFSAFSFSDETGVAKPHREAFIKILNELQCEPQNALHIGDIEKTDIFGAKQIGMMAIRYTGDKTAVINKSNTKETLADFESDSWIEIAEIINNL